MFCVRKVTDRNAAVAGFSAGTGERETTDPSPVSDGKETEANHGNYARETQDGRTD